MHPSTLTGAGLPASRRAAERPISPLLLVATAAAIFALVQPQLAGILRFDLADNDDAMRLAQVRDFLAGQGWFDTAQHRFLPPDGASMHWSRWIDLPIAGLIAALRAIMPPSLAEGLAIALWPPILFLVYTGIVFAETRRRFGERAAGYAVIAAALLPINGLWAMGRIDHHNVQATLLVAAALLVADPGEHRGRAGWRRPTFAGLLCGLSLAIGLETLPFVAGLGLVAGIAWIRDGERSARAFGAFGGALGAGSALFFAGQTAPGRWFVPECDVLSPPWFVLALGGGGGALILAASTRLLSTLRLRLLLAGWLGFALVGAFAAFCPSCLQGPYAGLPALARTGWLDHVKEATPLLSVLADSPILFLCLTVPTVTALVVCCLALRQGAGLQGRTFATLAVLLAIGLAVMAAQIRGAYVAMAFVPVAAGYAFERAFAARSLPRLGLALGMLGYVVGAAGVAVETAAGASWPHLETLRGTGTCVKAESMRSLDAVPPGLVLGGIEFGAALLTHTRHAIVAAPYHRNADAIVAGVEAVAGDENAVAEAVRRFRPDYVLACADWYDGDARAGSLMKQLVSGGAVPWLRPVPLPAEAKSLRLFRVVGVAPVSLRPALP